MKIVHCHSETDTHYSRRKEILHLSALLSQSHAKLNWALLLKKKKKKEKIKKTNNNRKNKWNKTACKMEKPLSFVRPIELDASRKALQENQVRALF